MPTLKEELTALINKHSVENGSNTPDFILANMLLGCLKAFEEATKARDEWYKPQNPSQLPKGLKSVIKLHPSGHIAEIEEP